MPAALATVASIVGVFVAIDSLTSAARLRRTVSFWTDQLQVTDIAKDHAVIRSLHRDATARLIALQAYPGRRLFVWVMLALLPIYAIGTSAFLAGTIATDDFTYRKLLEQGVDPFSVVLSCLGLLLALFKAADVLVHRRVLALRYLKGEGVTTKKEFSEGRPITEALEMTRWQFLLFGLFCIGFSLLTAAIGFALGFPRGDSPDATTLPEWWVILLFAGVMLAFLGLLTVVEMFTQKRDDWVHPSNHLPGGESHVVDERITRTKRLLRVFGHNVSNT